MSSMHIGAAVAFLLVAGSEAALAGSVMYRVTGITAEVSDYNDADDFNYLDIVGFEATFSVPTEPSLIATHENQGGPFTRLGGPIWHSLVLKRESRSDVTVIFEQSTELLAWDRAGSATDIVYFYTGGSGADPYAEFYWSAKNGEDTAYDKMFDRADLPTLPNALLPGFLPTFSTLEQGEALYNTAELLFDGGASRFASGYVIGTITSFQQVPAPGAALVLAGAGLMGLRRRR